MSNFCKDREIAVDVYLLFDILFNAHIIIPFGSEYRFHFTSWLYYFAAHRMYHDHIFADFILSDMRYSRFPEIIEFYTGIDRQRENAVTVLAKDLRIGIETVNKKCGLPKDLNPLTLLEWQPSAQILEDMQKELNEGVAESNLPPEIKDKYADRDYSRSKPYQQSVRQILSGQSMGSLMLSITAAARALRNSDYVNPDIRRELLNSIMDAWRQVSQILFVLLPPLTEWGHASFEGAWFILTKDFGNNPIDRFHHILAAIPSNVVKWYQDDLYSPKMTPLIVNSIDQKMNDLSLHEIILLLITKRPQGWKDIVQNYIHSVHKRFFYLCDVDSKLREQYKFSFKTSRDSKDLEYLIKMAATKHIYGVKKPKDKAIAKMPDSILPQPTATGSETI